MFLVYFLTGNLVVLNQKHPSCSGGNSSLIVGCSVAALIILPFQVKEIYNFTQDDLTTEDILVLDCCREIYVWIGCHSDLNSRQQALNIGQKFLETDILVEGLSLETPIYVVTEGHEPPFFTRFFAWDPLKAKMHGNSFERKLAILKGRPSIEASVRNSWKPYFGETTPDSLRSRSVSSNGLQGSGSPIPSISSSKLNSADRHRAFCETPTAQLLFSESTLDKDSPTGEPISSSKSTKAIQFNESEAGVSSLIYSYEQLRVDSRNPVIGIDVTKREAYLSEEEFQEKFTMTKRAFYELPKWKQNKFKMSLHLF